MELIDIVNKLVGPINPVGKKYIDDEHYQNLGKMIELMKSMHNQMDKVATKNTGRFRELSIGYLDWLGIPE